MKKGWVFTGAGGGKWYIGQEPELGKFYREFSAPTYQQAQAIAKQIIKDFEQQTS